MKPQCRLGVRGPESLESRTTPASVFNYTDIDGDKVTISASAGVLAGHATIVGGQLRLLDLSDPSFDHASITVTAVRAGAGDGLAAVGRINGGTNDLGAVSIKGDLGDIDCGSNSATVPALRSLSARSMGFYGLATQGGTGDLQSDIRGALGALKVAGDVKGVAIDVFGAASATLGPVTIGGSLVGGPGGAGADGAIFSSGDMGPVRIGHDVRGGAGRLSGFIHSFGKLAGVAVGGSLVGGLDDLSGAIFSDGDMGAVRIGHDLRGSGLDNGVIKSSGKLAGVAVGGSLVGGAVLSGGDMGPVRIGHDLRGGSGGQSGFIKSLGKLAGVAVGGSLVGGPGFECGAIFSGGDMGAVRIGGDITGASTTGGALDGSGLIESGGRIANVTVGGSIRAGLDDSAGGGLTNNASVRAAADIGAVTVKGSLVGSVGSRGAVTDVIISAGGQAFPTATKDIAIGSIRVGGRVERARVLAGYDTFPSPVNGNAQIGAVAVGGDWIASDLIAGVQDGGTAGFGDAGDTIIGGGPSIARIASVAIKGVVVGTSASGDRFGFESHTIGSFKVNGVSIPIASPVSLSPITGDVTLRLV